MNRPSGLRFEAPGEVLKRRVSLLVGAAVLFATSLVLGQVGAPAWGAFVEQCLAMCLLLAFGANAYRNKLRGDVFADGTGLRVGSEVVVDRARIGAAILLSPDGSVVRIFRRRALSVDVQVESEEKARALITALGVGIGQSITTFSARSGERARSLGLTVGAVLGAGGIAVMASGVLRGGGGPLSIACLLLLSGLFPYLLVRSFWRIDAGSDGVLIHRLGQQRFLSYGSMVNVVALGPNTMIITLRSGETIPLTVGGWMDNSQLRDALLERLEEARAAFAQGESIETAEAMVAPGGRAPQRWLKDVRALASARSYRETRLDEERLWRVVDDATALPATRAGAAIALSTLDEPSRIRLRVAAEACAEPKLRVALTRVAEGASDIELEEALAPLLESKS